jgi:hypothetical protein
MTRLICLCLLSIAMLVSAGAFAQGSDAAARALFEDGRALMDQKKYAEACAKFEGSQKIGAKASTALNLGVCYDKLEKFATAWSTFGTAAALAKREGHSEREKFAREQVTAMEAKLSHLTINVGTTVEGLEVMLNDKPFIVAMFGTAMPIDPGTHRLSATAPGKKRWSKEIVVPKEKADITETIPMLEDDEMVPVPTPTPSGEPVPVPTPTPTPTPAPATGSTSSTSALVYVGFSIAGAGVVVGTIAGVVAIANTGSIKDNCLGADEDMCPATESENISDAEVVANISNVGFAVGAVGLIIGIIGLFVGGDDSPEAAASGIEPMFGPDVVGVQGSF